MLRALLERGIAPDLVVGTSVGAINGAAIASEPSLAMVERLAGTWSDIERSDVFAGSLFERLATLARTRHAPARQRRRCGRRSPRRCPSC